MKNNKLVTIMLSVLLCLTLLPIHVSAETEIDTLNINVFEPTVGETIPNIQGPEPVEGSNYQCDPNFSISYVDEMGEPQYMKISDTFQKGIAYIYDYNFIVKEGYRFADDLKLVLNGKEPIDVKLTKGSNRVRLEYTYVAGAQNPTTYQIRHVREVTDGSLDYEGAYTSTFYGEAGELIKYDGNSKFPKHYMEPYPETVIDPDGSTIIDVIYRLKKHIVTFDPNGEPGIEPKQVTFKQTIEDFYTHSIPAFEEYENTSRKFECWTLVKDGACKYRTGDPYTEMHLTDPGIKELTLYAKYLPRHNDIENQKYVYDISPNNNEDLVIKYTTDNNSKINTIMSNGQKVNFEYVRIDNENRTITIKKEYFDITSPGKYDWTIWMIDENGAVSKDLKITINIPDKVKITPKASLDNIAKINIFVDGEWKEITSDYNIVKGSPLKIRIDISNNKDYMFYGIEINDVFKSDRIDLELDEVNEDLTIQAIVEKRLFDVSLDVISHDFGKSEVDTNGAVEKTFKIKNTGNQYALVFKDTLKNFEVSNFKSNAVAAEDSEFVILAPGDETEFTIKPKDNLPIGKYNEILTLEIINGTVQPKASTDGNAIIKEIKVSYEVTPKQVHLDLSSNIEGAAQLIGTGSYDIGSEVKAKAVANNGYRFIRWTKEGVEVSKDAEYTLTLNEDCKLVAEFERVVIHVEEPETPNTGDSGNIQFYASVLAVSLGAVILLMGLRKKYMNKN